MSKYKFYLVNLSPIEVLGCNDPEIVASTVGNDNILVINAEVGSVVYEDGSMKPVEECVDLNLHHPGDIMGSKSLEEMNEQDANDPDVLKKGEHTDMKIQEKETKSKSAKTGKN